MRTAMRTTKAIPVDLGRPAKDRILDAAMRRFSCQSYDATVLRDIAADAQVDVAYVHRAFGSKLGLFQKVLQSVVSPEGAEDVFDGSDVDLPGRLARRVATRSPQEPYSDIGAFELAMQSSTSVEARAAVLDFVENGFLQPLTLKLGHSDNARAVLITALLAGVDIMRSVIGAESVTGLEETWLQDSVTKLIEFAATLPPPAVPSGEA